MSGDAATHDEMVSRALTELAASVDVILLAQASMARVVEHLPEAARRIPIIASPPEAIKQLAARFKENA